MSKFCTISVNSDIGEITIMQPVRTFISAIDKARNMIAQSLESGLESNDICVYMTFAEVEEDSFPFCGVSQITVEQQGQLPQIRLNNSQTAMQLCIEGSSFDEFWGPLAEGFDSYSETEADILDKVAKMVFNAPNKTVLFGLV